MSSLTNWFGWLGNVSVSDEIPMLFPLGITERDFVLIDVVEIYSKILTDVLERTDGLSDEYQVSLFDNCVKSENCHGLITMLARAMTHKRELFLVYDRAVKLLREARPEEKSQIEADYKAQGTSTVGAYISFQNYFRTDMIWLYSSLEYCTVSALNKSLNLSKAIQIKISDLRKSVALSDAAEAKNQAISIAKGLSKGKDVYMDKDDVVETAIPDLTAVKASMEFLNAKRSFYLGMPASYINGILNSGLGDSGQADSKAIERGLKNYFFSIIKPVLATVFDVQTQFKEDDFGQILNSLEAMKTFSITDGELVSEDNKRKILNKMLGLPEDEQGDPPEAEPPAPPVQPPGAPPPAAVPY
jgi:hypothetical protein